MLHLVYTIACLFRIVSGINIAVVSPCSYQSEFGKSIASNIAEKDDTSVVFVTDSECGEGLKIPGVEIFYEGAWSNSSHYSSGVFSSFTNTVQDRINEVVHSAEALQRLFERKELDLVVAGLYQSCAVAVAEMHEVPVILLYNTPFEPPSSTSTYHLAPWVPSWISDFLPLSINSFLYQAYVVFLRNLPDLRMTTSVANKCHLDLRTNISHHNIFHFWANFPKISPFDSSFLRANERTRGFTPLPDLPLVDKLPARSTRLNAFISTFEKEMRMHDGKLLYFTGERQLVSAFGADSLMTAFERAPKHRVVWTNDSISPVNRVANVLVSKLTAHSILSRPEVDGLIGSCSVDSVLLAQFYKKPLLCIQSSSYLDTPMVDAVRNSGLGIALSYWSTQGSIVCGIEQFTANMPNYTAALNSRKVIRNSRETLMALIEKHASGGSSRIKSADDPVNHVIELIILAVTFLMFVRFTMRVFRWVWRASEPSTRKLVDQDKKSR